MISAKALLIISALYVASGCAVAAGTADRREGDLQEFINIDSEDIATKLEVLRHSLDALELKLTRIAFRQLYGDNIRMEKIRYPVDLDLIPGYIFLPKHREAGHRYPAIVLVHGGYHSSLTEEFFPFISRAVSEGFVVIFPEYRGSKGYGAEHYRALNYGGKEVDDVLGAAKHLAERDYIDKNRLGIVGRSKGGMLALLAIEKEPDFFRAAVHMVGLVDFVAYMAYKPEYRRQDVARQPNFDGKLPFENLPAYLQVSPLTHVDRIETPLLILATTHDRTVPVDLHAQRLIDALEARGKVFEAKIYDKAPGGHAFAHGESPEARDAEDRTFAFLDKYLQ